MDNWLEKMKIFLGFQEEPEVIQAPQQPTRQSLQKETPPNVVRGFGFRGSLINNNASKSFSGLEIKVIEPRIYEDSLTIATYLREVKPVIVNLKYLDSPSGKRLIDFICGTAYAINGHMLKIGENIFLFTPENVLIADATGDKTNFEEPVQEEKEVYFKQAAF